MKVKKTVGFEHGSSRRKGYVIHTECGKEFACVPDGSYGYILKGQRHSSIKDAKAFIEAGDVDCGDPVETSPALEGEDTWDCVHPCALLVRFYDMGLLSVIGHRGHKQIHTECKTTLDAYGWLDSEGRPDIEKADRELERVRRLKVG
tara:strand:+ start:1513 stop:1953 length:441 start_codon:yes stop_codon:yes gene_type:complete